MQESNSRQSELGRLNVDSVEKLNRIRDLIFGQQSREYEQKFDRQRQELARMSQELTRVGELVRTLESTINAQLKLLGEQLSGQVEEQNKRHTQLLNELAQRVDQQLHALDHKYQEEVELLTLALSESEATMMGEIRASTERLHDQKADRVKLGNLLMDIGATLKSHDSAEVVTDLLQELADTIE